MNLRNSVQFTAEHIVAVHVFKDWQLCDNPSNNVACLMDNCSQEDFVQICNINVKQGVDVGKTIFSLFLGIPNSCLTSIMKLKPHTEKNSTRA